MDRVMAVVAVLSLAVATGLLGAMLAAWLAH